MVTESEWLLADIGGTNARFAIATRSTILCNKIYPTRRYPDLMEALDTFLRKECEGRKPVMAALALAGPVLGDVVRLTNVDWICDKNLIKQQFKLEHIEIVNDFEAVAYALNRLASDDVSILQQGEKSPHHPMLVIGPGTGLGVAALVPHDDGFKAVPTEGGHIRYAPANTRESQMISIIAREHQFVTAEHLISGPGLVNIYKALCDMSNKIDQALEPLEPADIVAFARAGDAIAKDTLEEFAAIFGSFTSQIALSYNALGGLYMAGGVLQKIGQDFDTMRFLNRFATNPKMANLLRRIPIVRVNADIPAFMGLQWLLDHKESKQRGLIK